MRSFFLFMIRFYQRTFSFDHGPLKIFFPDGYCRFYPSCSEYGYLCVKRYGVVKGSFLTLRRIFRCNPFSFGGIDEPPIKKIPTKSL
ncbi:MAG: hypothetical protein UT30_C0010G0034 [Candidatus Uhrbacteria bacterium GW2011_GWF2_39_13]|uniref:Putative membrane protein insertion efficiency factor n=1 Tax=Candidatus Uhrbacteria bacterium GW2011_GWF2_39_13 TaxID=1618995 RepID=A0A0G0Q1H4_9BACT|nr:MAG: hypothetical protein UT30_C0010G0034 [Candidatus Uhrbacteria bacterium GW2011_GWF2_39_13]HAU65814.1 membrane protein insertion efficiency factor YidD [Candidatus Uhrbacteria bacterium]